MELFFLGAVFAALLRRVCLIFRSSLREPAYVLMCVLALCLFWPDVSPPLFGTVPISDFLEPLFPASGRKCGHIAALSNLGDFGEMEFGKVSAQRAAFRFVPDPGNFACWRKKRRRFRALWVELGTLLVFCRFVGFSSSRAPKMSPFLRKPPEFSR